MKINSVFIILGVAMLTIFSACQKHEEPVDPCSNGFLDPGEDAPDCGATIHLVLLRLCPTLESR